MHTKITYHFHFRSLPPDNIPTFNILPLQPPGQGLKEPHDGLGRERPRPRERLQHVRPWQAAAEGEHVLEGLARGQRAGKVAAVERAGVAGDLAEALSELELQDGAGEVPVELKERNLILRCYRLSIKESTMYRDLKQNLVQRFIDKWCVSNPNTR